MDSNYINSNTRIILMDNQMPIMDGITATLLLRKKQYQGCIIMISGDSLEDDKKRMLDAGVNDILIKPIRKDLLYNLVDKYLDNSLEHIVWQEEDLIVLSLYIYRSSKIFISIYINYVGVV